jgi:hypothetical protein
LAHGWGSQRIKEAIGKRRHTAQGALLWIEALAAIATVAAIAIGLVNHFTSGGDARKFWPYSARSSWGIRAGRRKRSRN